jgi:hypothetical protein
MAEGPMVAVGEAERLFAPVFAGGPRPKDCAKARANGHARIARFLLRDGNLAGAKERYERAVAAARETTATVPKVKWVASEIAMSDGDPVRLRETCDTLRAAFRETDNPYDRWHALRRLVCALRIADDPEAADRERDLDEMSARLDRRESEPLYTNWALASRTLRGLLTTCGGAP